MTVILGGTGQKLHIALALEERGKGRGEQNGGINSYGRSARDCLLVIIPSVYKLRT